MDNQFPREVAHVPSGSVCDPFPMGTTSSVFVAPEYFSGAEIPKHPRPPDPSPRDGAARSVRSNSCSSRRKRLPAKTTPTVAYQWIDARHTSLIDLMRGGSNAHVHPAGMHTSHPCLEDGADLLSRSARARTLVRYPAAQRQAGLHHPASREAEQPSTRETNVA